MSSVALLPMIASSFPNAADLSRCRSELLARGMALEATRTDLAEARESCKSRKLLYSEQLVSAMKMGEPCGIPTTVVMSWMVGPLVVGPSGWLTSRSCPFEHHT